MLWQLRRQLLFLGGAITKAAQFYFPLIVMKFGGIKDSYPHGFRKNLLRKND
jgi:hypothetical protein